MLNTVNLVVNFLDHKEETKIHLQNALKTFFNKNTLVLNDTRLSIKPDILPHIPFVGSYDQRILSILSNTTVVFSHPFYTESHQYFSSLWLSDEVEVLTISNNHHISLTEHILSNEWFVSQLRDRNFQNIINFSVNEHVEILAEKIGAKCLVSSEVSHLANDKLKLKQFLEHSGLPTIEGVYTDDPDIIASYFWRKDHYFFKDPQGVSGYGFWSNQNNTLEQILSEYGWKDIIIERVIEKESSPSVQFLIYEDAGEKYACIFGFTDQILQEWRYYLGNQSPSVYVDHHYLRSEFMRQSEIIMHYLFEIGYVGFWWIDFMVGDGQVYATEINARFTWATYPAITSYLLSGSLITPWKYITREGAVDSHTGYLEQSIRSPDEYGMFPLCIAPLEDHGRAQLLFIGDEC